MGVHGSAGYVCVCVRGYARVCVGIHRGAQCGQVCIGVHWSVQVCVKVCRCLPVCVCGMNSQNIYSRIESLHQRTLIRILYEFFTRKYKYTTIKVIKEKWGQYFVIDHFCTPLCSKRNGILVIKKILEQKFAKSSEVKPCF